MPCVLIVTEPSNEVPEYSVLQSDCVGPDLPVASQFVKVNVPEDEEVAEEFCTP